MDRNTWKHLAGDCVGDEECEGIYLTDRGMVAVQGEHLAEARIPPGEAIVEVSQRLLKEAARALG